MMSHRPELSRAWILGATTFILLITAIAIAHIDVRVFLNDIRQVSPGSLLGAAALLIVGAQIAAVRLWFISSDIGTPLTVREAMLALSVGQIVGAVSVQFFGQIAARSALLGRRGVSAPANIVMVSYERLAAVAVCGFMAAIAVLFLFGHLAFDLESGGAQFLEIIAGIVVVIAAGGWVAWGSAALQALRRMMSVKTLIAIARSSFLTLAIQLCTAGAYVVIAHSLAATTPLASLFAASFIVMFAASLPISFSGWGVRELSAVLALSAIGITSTTALTVAVLVGVIALVAVIFVAGLSVIWPTAEVKSIRAAAVPEDAKIAAALKWVLPLGAGTAVFFQIYVPIGATNLNVNLADPIVILGAAVFILEYVIRGETQWRFPALNISIVIATAVIVLSYFHGYYVFGWSSWAFTNRLLGWFVLLCYGMTGGLIVRNAGERGATMLARTFIASAAAIVIFGLALIIIDRIGIRLPAGIVALPMEGFSQNRNAFSFIMLLSICTLPLLPRHTRPIILSILMLGLWFAGSRAALGTFVVLTGAMVLLKVFSLREFSFALIGFGVGLAFIGGGKANHSFVFIDEKLYGSSNIQRFESIMAGFQLFLSHPIVGAGLGFYMTTQIKSGTPLVIHSTPVWLLAETGIVGLTAFVVPAALIILREWPRRYHDQAAQVLIMALLVFGIMSSVHELLYQRMLWLLLGAFLTSTQRTV